MRADAARASRRPPRRGSSRLVDHGGRPLSDDVRVHMERALGHDFADVRVHESNAPVHLSAEALTQGHHIHFPPGRFRPDTISGRRLLGHELTHVVQQRDGRAVGSRPTPLPIDDDPRLEFEADRGGQRAAAGLIARDTSPSRSSTPSSLTVQAGAPIQAKPILRNGETVEVEEDYELQPGEQNDDAAARAMRLVLGHGVLAPGDAARARGVSKSMKAAVENTSWESFTGREKDRHLRTGVVLGKLAEYEKVGVHGTLRKHQESLNKGIRVPTREEIVSEGNQLGAGFYVAPGHDEQAREIAKQFGHEARIKAKAREPYGVYDVLRRKGQDLKNKDLELDETFTGKNADQVNATLDQLDASHDTMTSPIFGKEFKGREQVKFTRSFLEKRSTELMVLPPSHVHPQNRTETGPSREEWGSWTDAHVQPYERTTDTDVHPSTEERREVRAHARPAIKAAQQALVQAESSVGEFAEPVGKLRRQDAFLAEARTSEALQKRAAALERLDVSREVARKRSSKGK